MLGLTSASGLSRTAAARSALVQLLALFGCGALAWLTLAWLVPPLAFAGSSGDGSTGSGAAADFVGTLANETLTIIVLGAFAAAALLVLPFGRLPGRALFEWSKPAWFAVALVAFTVLAAVIAPSFEHAGRQFALAQAVLVVTAFRCGQRLGLGLAEVRRPCASRMTSRTSHSRCRTADERIERRADAAQRALTRNFGGLTPGSLRSNSRPRPA